MCVFCLNIATNKKPTPMVSSPDIVVRNQKFEGNKRTHHSSITSQSLNVLWSKISAQEKRQSRAKRQRAKQRAKRQACIKNRLSKEERFKLRVARNTIDDCKISRRRAVIMTAQGLLCPIKLLPYTDHKHGVVGSLFDDQPLPLAYKILNPRSKLLMFGPNRNFAVPWKIKAYKTAEHIGLTFLQNELKGSALILRMTLNQHNMPYIDDYPILPNVQYVEQKEFSQMPTF